MTSRLIAQAALSEQTLASLNTFLSQNPGLDLSTFNFSDAAQVANLNFTDVSKEELVPLLQALQRLFFVTKDVPLAKALLAAGLRSCFQIASMPEDQFIRDFIAAFNNDAGLTAKTYARALVRRTQIEFHFMRLRDHTSAHYRALRADNVSTQTDDTQGHLPSYEELFGSLDFQTVPTDRSIFSPAAYLMDLLHFRQLTIQDRGQDVAADFKLETRRPDLNRILLDAEQTETLVPKLEIVNLVLEDQFIRRERGMRQMINEAAFSPQVHLRLDGSIADASNPTIPVALSGTERYDAGRSAGSTAFRFDGHTTLTTLSLEPTPAFTLSAWVKISDGQGGRVFTVPGGIIFQINRNNEVYLGFDLGDAAGTVLLSNGGAFLWDGRKIRRVSSDSWHHIAARVSGGSAIILVDGEVVSGVGGFTGTLAGPVLIGEGFTGTLDEVLIHNRALTIDEIKQLAARRSEAEQEHDAVYELLAHNNFPFALPFNLPLEEIRANLRLLKSSLPELWNAFVNPEKEPATSIYAESLGLSPREMELLIADELITTGDLFHHVLEAFALEDLVPPVPNLPDDITTAMSELMRIEVFLEKTGLTPTQLDDLIYGDLSEEELSDHKVRENFFINATDEPPPVEINKQTGNLDNLSLTRADRIHQIIRLAAKTGLSFPDIDWALQTVTGITEEKIEAKQLELVARLLQWKKNYGLSVDEACALLGKRLRDFGGTNGVTFFDQIYNKLSAKDQPLKPDSGLQWEAGKTVAGNQPIAHRLMAALGVTQDELMMMQEALLSVPDSLLPIPGRVLSLDAATFASLYRLSLLAKMFGLSVRELLEVLELMGPQSLAAVTKGLSAETADVIDRLAETRAWLRLFSLSPDKLHYILTGETNATARTGVAPEDAVKFIQQLQTAFTPTRLAQGSLPGQNGTPQEVLTRLPVFDPVLRDSPEGQPVTGGKAGAKLLEMVADEGGIVVQVPQAAHPVAEPSGTPARSIAIKDSPDQSKEILEQHHDNQEKAIEEQLGALFKVSHLRIAQIERWLSPQADFFSLILWPVLIDPVPPNGTADSPQRLQNFNQTLKMLELINRYVELTTTLHLTHSEIEAMLDHPEIFEISQPRKLSLDIVERLSDYKQLCLDLKDRQHNLLGYFKLALESERQTAFAFLAGITGWEEDHIEQVARHLWPGPGAAKPWATVAGLERLKSCFALSRKLGLAVETLIKLDGLRGQNNFAAFSEASQSTLAAVKATYSETDWERVYEPLRMALAEKKREALVPVVLNLLNEQGVNVPTSRELYEYLLIDVETSGAFQTSVIEEAISSLQLYIYRCQMQLENGVSVTKDFDKWWEWMQTYRVWEANRKIFLYPENYLEPELRPGKTPLFAQLEQALHQTHIREESIETAVRTYLDGLAEVANLKIAGSFVHQVPDPANPEHPEKHLYLIGRSVIAPYQYYYRTGVFAFSRGRYEAIDWTPWVKTDLRIPGKYLSPVFAFNKLFVFWVEIKPAPSDREDSGGPNNTGRITGKRFEAHLQFSFYKFNKTWVAAQPIGEPILLPKDVNTREKAEATVWQRIDLAYRDSDERITVKYPGFVATLGRTLVPDFPVRIRLSNGVNPVSSRTGGDGITRADNRFGDPAAAFLFEGSAITLPVGQYPTSFTISTWVKIGEGQGGSVFTARPLQMALRDGGSAQVTSRDYSLIFQINHNNEVFVDTPLGDAAGTVLLWGGGGFLWDAGKRKRLIPESWHHIAALVSGGDAAIFVNGEPVSIASNFGGAISGLVRIGEGFAGTLDEVLIYNRALTIDEIIQLASREFVLESAPLQLPAGSTKTNVSGSGGWFILDTANAEYLAIPKNADKTQYIRLNSTAVHQLSELLFAEGIDGLLRPSAQQESEDSFSRLNLEAADPKPPDTLDFLGANGLYFQELFFFTPLLIANTFNTSQQFDIARRWYHYVFNPFVRDDGTGQDRFWRYIGLRRANNPVLKAELSRDPENELEAELGDALQLNHYFNNPFDPQVIAELRPLAWQKYVVMRYVRNLLDQADQLYRRDTRETLVEATMLYVLAYDLMGKRPEDGGELPLPSTATVGELLEQAGGKELPEFLIRLEQDLPDGPEVRPLDTPNNFIPGIYFGVPENEQFLAYWDQVEGRLFNLRHYLTIDGAAQHLALFEPPLDPKQLAQAVAASGVGSVLGAAAAPVPHYRFKYMVEKAREATSTVIQFGAVLLSTLERGDADQLDLLRAAHESALLNMSRSMKDSQMNAAQATVQSLKSGLEAAKFRVDYYTQLLEEGRLKALPNDIAPQIEQTQIALELSSVEAHNVSSGLRAGALIAHLIPTVYGLADGDFQPGSAISESANISDARASMLSQGAGLAGTQAQYLRRAEEWFLQREIAMEDVEQINAQLQSAQFQVDVANAEIENLEETITQAAEIESFLKSRFTNQELYQWMTGRLASLYFQAYQLAHSLAISTQMAWQFEQGETQTFIQAGYWDDLRKGLLAGEALLLDLQRLEKACLDNNQRRLEIVKTISLNTDFPESFTNLKNNGECIFGFLNEFDKDYPRHYRRKIHSLLVSLPALLGPYQNIHATLTQTSSRTDLKGDGVPTSDFRPNQKIAISQGINDSGVFELSFYDERYLPFEGTGAVSDWHLEIPIDSNPGLHQNLTDVVIELRYTALSRTNL
jgi:hypothetical protein